MNDTAPPSATTLPPPPDTAPLKSVSKEQVTQAFKEWLADLADGEVLYRPHDHQLEVYADALWSRLN